MTKPSNVSRRGFLRAMGVTSMGILVPSLILPEKKELIRVDKPLRFSNNTLIMIPEGMRWQDFTHYSLHQRSPKKVTSIG